MQSTTANPTLVILLTWFLTWLVGKFFTSKQSKMRSALPAVAFLLAFGLEIGYHAINSAGSSLSWALVGRALGEAGAAVIAHSQFREVVKMLSDDKQGGSDDKAV